jgi:uncharacterized Tic20 family protein
MPGPYPPPRPDPYGYPGGYPGAYGPPPQPGPFALPPPAWGYGPPPPPGPYGGPPVHLPYGPPAPYGAGITAADDTTWALFGYLGVFVIGIIAPLVVYFSRKDRSPFVRFHGAQALNLALTQLIVVVAGILISVVTLGLGLIVAIPAFVVFGITHLIYVILAAVRAGRGEPYRIPAWLCWRMIR